MLAARLFPPSLKYHALRRPWSKETSRTVSKVSFTLLSIDSQNLETMIGLGISSAGIADFHIDGVARGLDRTKGKTPEFSPILPLTRSLSSLAILKSLSHGGGVEHFDVSRQAIE